jgi:hypothetical protein
LETQSPNNTNVPQNLTPTAANDPFAEECLLFKQTGGGVTTVYSVPKEKILGESQLFRMREH